MGRNRNRAVQRLAAQQSRDILPVTAGRGSTAGGPSHHQHPVRWSATRFPGTPGYIRSCGGPGWALVGDAGYYKDPITAHGITDALRDAELLARAILDAPR